ncbi:uroporphyrinogen-III synthase [Alteromonas sp. 1_MG-2023]|uniref:uroporphyrinogen-III synthase n=1 Tax=Alteromonas sp. 1_MG-2023 TaxID=3062669 RepID=UPI0026E3DE41|nr:uroporphyrinogen-III synthase [Alteromonas sp. 1_MG-2023]MDO6566580.1 uroporphyrinogen-III synthase [Alteromonas sp. 1_MG-2023]
MLLITRPLPKLQASADAFEQAGIDAVGIATSDIQSVPGKANALKQFLISSNSVNIIIVTSIYAVPAALDALSQASFLASPAALDALSQASFLASPPTLVAVGDATASALHSANLPFKIVTPSQHTSEGILVMQQLNEANCTQVVIIKGEGGRDTLSRVLGDRGISATEFCVYKREPLANPFYTKVWKIDDVRGIIATSENLAKQLISTHSRQILALPWLTVSERVATSLRNYGIARVSVCNRATDQALIAWIKDNWEY